MRMRWPRTRRGRWLVIAGLLYLGRAAWEFKTDGITGSAISWVFTATLFVAIGYRSDATTQDPPWRESSPRQKAIYVLLGGVALLAVSGFGLETLTRQGAPLLAGPALEAVEVTTTSTVGSAAATPGYSFVVAEATVASRLGAPLRHVHPGDFQLETTRGTLEAAFMPTLALPGACNGFDIRPWRSRRCTVVFEVPTDTEVARLRFEDSLRTARSQPLLLRDLP